MGTPLLIIFFSTTIYTPFAYVMYMKDEQTDSRIVFRPTVEQHKRLQNVFMKLGRFRSVSEMMRYIVEIGLKELEGEL